MEINMSRRIFAVVVILISGLLLSACYSYGVSGRILTPVPTLIHATMSSPLVMAMDSTGGQQLCKVRPVDLLGAWVGAGLPESEPFSFESVDGEACRANYEDDIQTLFSQSNLWFEGAPACISCHHSDLETSLQFMDLSSYAGVMAGAERKDGIAQGEDILGGGVWEDAIMYEMLITRQMPLGRSEDSSPKGPEIYAGRLVDTAE
jgi:hypothetical protein